jgi:FixJ family two-component response regulator
MFNFFKKNGKEYYFYALDDEADVLEIIVDLIETTFPCKVKQFSNMKDLIAELKKSTLRPDLIFSDVRLGNESGWHLKDMLSDLGYDIPILYITGLSGKEGFLNGFCSINKPVSKESLEKFTNILLEESKKKNNK